MIIDHDTIGLDPSSEGAVCCLCDNAVEKHDEAGICVSSHYQHIAHAHCIQQAWNEEDNDDD